MKQFGRRWKLDISNDQETLSIEQLRVAFEIDKTINEKPNPGKIQVWNLNRDHINQLLSGAFQKATLSVGYGELRQIYSGDITKARVLRHGLDFVLTLECADGHQAYTKSRATTTLNTKQKGELHSTGAISSDTDVKAAGISGKSHTHRGDSGGTTGTPQ
ncbi:hypothetical protein N7761_10280 [Aggregatibacter actinomycetemcomitans]|nr:hypothetical protein [Aggregatibacter actinomycetemcomitans]AEW77472.1 hypothetical protein ANH9381_1518 [Aggregatibacter actinomycetemcomitans ANH9381]KOE53308.1 hypothetical protein S23A_0207885 [Aggregatibacter actinomycetemcomitans serotype b str. S23A]KOE53488.1 hypothetical protein I23C_0305955 [Aggregatibacter actinomycetemcomitans serotype b str. I23C]UXM97535.1 hypothetical protein N7761_10280 [Aggregatibacter actinomycetemcomitans]